MPVRQEKGKVTQEDYSTSADIKDITDVEYFRDKLFSGLRVPRQFLGYGEMLPGVGSAGSLMRVDVRYSRTVKRLRRRIREGIKQLIDNVFSVDGEDLPAYKIVSVPVSSPEDEERNAETEQRVSVGQSVLDIIANPETMRTDRGRAKMMADFFDNVIQLPALSKFMREISENEELDNVPPTTGEEGAPVEGEGAATEEEFTEE